MTDNEFTLEEDERLIEEIARRPEIYDPNHAGYKQLTVKDQRWADIAKKLDKAGEYAPSPDFVNELNVWNGHQRADH